jgi:hypothetical protein
MWEWKYNSTLTTALNGSGGSAPGDILRLSLGRRLDRPSRMRLHARNEKNLLPGIEPQPCVT